MFVGVYWAKAFILSHTDKEVGDVHSEIPLEADGVQRASAWLLSARVFSNRTHNLFNHDTNSIYKLVPWLFSIEHIREPNATIQFVSAEKIVA